MRTDEHVRFRAVGDVAVGYFKTHPPKKNTERKWKMIGILFVKGGDELAEKHLKPYFDYFDIRSSDGTDFIWAGWGKHYKRREVTIKFDAKRFDETRDALSSHTEWKYNGGAELVLFAANFIEDEVVFDLAAAMCIDLRSLMLAGLPPDALFERIFDFANTYDGSFPIADLFFSNTKTATQSGFWTFLKGVLPKELSQEIDKIKNLAIRDIGKKGRPMVKKIGPSKEVRSLGPLRY